MTDIVKKTMEEGKPPTIIFTLMTLTNILINLDHGILPACTNELKKQYDMNQTELGFLGSIVYLGIVIMGLFAGQLYQRINSKILTMIALLALEASLLFFILSSNKYLAYFCRFLTGVCQVFLLVYYPIWIDKFGFKNKTLWLTLLQICVPVGIFAGYGMTSGVIALGFQYKVSFYLQIVLVAFFIVAFALLSKKKLDSRRKLSEQFNDQLQNPSTKNQNKIDKVISESILTQENNQNKILEVSQNEVEIALNPGKRKHHSFMYMMKKLLRSKMYFVGTMTMAIILFVSTGVQFWLTDYFINVLHFQRQRVNIAYAIVSITGPTSGCGFGGFILSKRGGYDNPRSVYYVFVFSAIGIGSAIVIPFLDNFYPVAIALWIVLFFGGAMMPGLTGIMMASVPPYLRPFGNSTGEIIKNIFGYLPAPFVYGWFNSMFNQRAGLKLIMFWGLWAPILLGFGSFYRFRQLQKLDKAEYQRRRKNSLQKVQIKTQQQVTVSKQNQIISQYLAQQQQHNHHHIKEEGKDENKSTNSNSQSSSSEQQGKKAPSLEDGQK